MPSCEVWSLPAHALSSRCGVATAYLCESDAGIRSSAWATASVLDLAPKTVESHLTPELGAD